MDRFPTVDEMIRQLQHMSARGLGDAPILVQSPDGADPVVAGHPSLKGVEAIGELGRFGPLVRQDLPPSDTVVIIEAGL